MHAADDRANPSPANGTLLARPLSRRRVLQGGMTLGAAVLAGACGSSTPTRSPAASAIGRVLPSIVPSVSPSAAPVVLTEDILRKAQAPLVRLLLGATLPLPGGGTAKAADLETAGTALDASTGSPTFFPNPVAALGLVLAAADWSGQQGVLDLSATLPGLPLRVVRLVLPALPGGGATDALAQATPPGLVLRPQSALLLAGVTPDGGVVLGVSDPVRQVAAHPRLELAILAPATLAALLTLVGASLDGAAVALPDGRHVSLASTDAGLTATLVTASGACFVDQVPIQPKGTKPALLAGPVVPSPDTSVVPAGSRISRASDGRILALNSGGKPIARAADLGGTWQWVGPDKAAGLDFFLRELADGLGIRIGVAPDGAQYGNPAYTSRIGEYFNHDEIFMGDWGGMNPSPGHFQFGWQDGIVAFAQANAMTTQSYLIVGSPLPDWLTVPAHSRAQLRAFAEEYVTALVGHFKGKINVWQVINEPIYGALWQPDPKARFWQDHFAEEYDAFVAEAYGWARRADPQATLLLTDWYNDGRSLELTNDFITLVESLLAKGTPLDGVGLECHFPYIDSGIDTPFSPTLFAQTIARYQALGLQVFVTEFDVDMTGFTGTQAEEEAAQAEYYRGYLQAALDAGVKNFTIYGLTDATSWYTLPFPNHPLAHPLLLRGDYTPKPAYFAVIDVLKAELRKRGWKG